MSELQSDWTGYEPPVKEGDVVELTCVQPGKVPNSGVCKYRGYVIFVEGLQLGESARVKITRVKPKFAFALKEEN